MASRIRGAQRNGVHRRLDTSLRGLTLKVGGALEEESEESRSWLELSLMVGVRGQVSPGSGNSSGGLRYSSSEVIGLLKGDVDPPGGEDRGHQGKEMERGKAAPAGPALISLPVKLTGCMAVPVNSDPDDILQEKSLE